MPFDETDFQRQSDTLKSKREELELAIGQANHNLRRSLHLEAANPQARIWPATDLRPIYEPLDAEFEVQQGLATRQDIQVLRDLAYRLDGDSLDAGRQLLASFQGGLGSAPSRELSHLACLFGNKARAAEAQARRGQLSQLSREREIELAEDIRQAVATIDGRLRQINLAEDLAASWQTRSQSLHSESVTGKTGFPQISEARLKALEARGDLIHDIVAWKTAVVKLKELKGQLIVECGAGGCPMSVATEEVPPATAAQ